MNNDGFFDALDCQGTAGTIEAGPGVTINGNEISIDTGFTDTLYWKLGGNLTASPSPQFLGTSNNAALHLGANGQANIRIQPRDVSPNLALGHPTNSVDSSAVGGTIGGGGSGDLGPGTGPNLVSGDFGAVSGGLANLADATASTIAGGQANDALGEYSAVLGGLFNEASGPYATVAGGDNNTALGANSFAAGHRAKAMHVGSFVWADSTSLDVASTRDNQFLVHATGGTRFEVGSGGQWIDMRQFGNRLINTSSGAYLSLGGAWTNSSDRAMKQGIVEVDGVVVLEQLDTLPVYTWNYIVEGPQTVRMGPMADEFFATFGLGDDDQVISTVDSNGVALAALKGLHAKVKTQQTLIEAQQVKIQEMETKIAAIEAFLSHISAYQPQP